MERLRTLCLVMPLLAGFATDAVAQLPATWREQQVEAMDKSDAIMKRAHGRKDLLAH